MRDAIERMTGYRKPEIADYGDLQALTASCLNLGDGDEAAKGFIIPLATVPSPGDKDDCPW